MGNSLRDHESGVRAAQLASLYLAAGLITVILLVFVELREYPAFWRNEGGYPIWLRELVLFTFYPLLTLQFVILGTTSIFQFRTLPDERSHRVWLLAMVALLWILFGVVIGLLAANNLDNVLSGRELHYHPPPPSNN